MDTVDDVKLPGPDLEVNSEGVPIIYERALIIYDYMLANLEDSIYEDKYQQYRGRITEELEEEYGITPSQYSRSMKLLKDVNAVEQVGRSNEGSHWVLYRRPEIEEFYQLRKERHKSRRTPSKQEALLQRINDLIEVVGLHEQRISHLERMLDGQD